MAVIPSITDAQGAYTTGTAANAQKWEARTAAAASEWEAKAKSPAAEQAYGQGVQVAVANQLRLKGLQGVTASEFSGAVRGRSGAYREKTAARAAKWGTRFSPFLDTIRTVVPGLPPRVPGDIAGNIQRRVTPIATALHNQKLGGVSPAAGYGAAPAAGYRYGTSAPY